ncbi:uncharacterized protein LOC118838267 [Trichosurus vulpecula]|uniref:uncharacterized protein LOC118838267 n=1 Tax=Trichosurus vulpecula TaxID=9337 RepID=UPI00186AD28C|nr:uncharacterized protein LOC118838267 [Trichosurus vulpecula]
MGADHTPRPLSTVPGTVRCQSVGTGVWGPETGSCQTAHARSQLQQKLRERAEEEAEGQLLQCNSPPATAALVAAVAAAAAAASRRPRSYTMFLAAQPLTREDFSFLFFLALAFGSTGQPSGKWATEEGLRKQLHKSEPGSGLRLSPMWQEAMRRRRYLLDRAEAATGGGGNGSGSGAGGCGGRLHKSRDWLYESYYCMSQQHPLIVFLLIIIMGTCLALLSVFFALGLEVEDHVAFLITVPTALAIFFAIFILVCIESVFKKLLRVFSLVIWVCLVAMGYLFMCFEGSIFPWDQELKG